MNSYQIIMMAMNGLEVAVKLVNSLTAAAKARSELTDDQWVEVRLKQREIMQSDHWKIDPDPK